MIVVTGEIEMHPEDAWPAATAALKMMEATRDDDGCLIYRYYTDLMNPRILRVYEEWRDEEALAAHFQTPHSIAFKAKMDELRITRRKMKKFFVETDDV